MSRYISCTQPIETDDNDDSEVSDFQSGRRLNRNRMKKCSQEVKYRVVILGAEGVGKSTIISQFLYGHLPNEIPDDDLMNSATLTATTTTTTTTESSFLTTVRTTKMEPTTSSSGKFELHTAQYDVDDMRLTLEVLEVMDDDDRGPGWQEAVALGDAFVIVYSVSDDRSREMINRLRNDILEQHCYLYLPLVVVANKTDTDDGSRHEENVITEMVTVEDWGHGHTYTSAAADPDSLGSIFLELFRLIEFAPDHVMKFWFDLHKNKNNQRQRKRPDNILHRLSRRVRKFINI